MPYLYRKNDTQKFLFNENFWSKKSGSFIFEWNVNMDTCDWLILQEPIVSFFLAFFLYPSGGMERNY